MITDRHRTLAALGVLLLVVSVLGTAPASAARANQQVLLGSDRRLVPPTVIDLDLDGDTITWAQRSAVDSRAPVAIYALDLSTGNRRKVAEAPGRTAGPRVAGNSIAWSDSSGTYLRTGRHPARKVTGTVAGLDVSPSLLAWADGPAIGTYSRPTGQIDRFRATEDPTQSVFQLAVSGKRMVWAGYRTSPRAPTVTLQARDPGGDVSTIGNLAYHDHGTALPSLEIVRPSLDGRRIAYVGPDDVGRLCTLPCTAAPRLLDTSGGLLNVLAIDGDVVGYEVIYPDRVEIRAGRLSDPTWNRVVATARFPSPFNPGLAQVVVAGTRVAWTMGAGLFVVDLSTSAPPVDVSKPTPVRIPQLPSSYSTSWAPIVGDEAATFVVDRTNGAANQVTTLRVPFDSTTATTRVFDAPDGQLGAVSPTERGIVGAGWCRSAPTSTTVAACVFRSDDRGVRVLTTDPEEQMPNPFGSGLLASDGHTSAWVCGPEASVCSAGASEAVIRRTVPLPSIVGSYLTWIPDRIAVSGQYIVASWFGYGGGNRRFVVAYNRRTGATWVLDDAAISAFGSTAVATDGRRVAWVRDQREIWTVQLPDAACSGCPAGAPRLLTSLASGEELTRLVVSGRNVLWSTFLGGIWRAPFDGRRPPSVVGGVSLDAFGAGWNAHGTDLVVVRKDRAVVRVDLRHRF